MKKVTKKLLVFAVAVLSVFVFIYFCRVFHETSMVVSKSLGVGVVLENYVDRNSVDELKVKKEIYNIKKPVAIAGNKKTVRKFNQLKYILQWTSDRNVPFVDMGKGQEGFVSRKCPYTNCFVTSNRRYFDDYRKFDVVAFSGPELSEEYFYGIEKPKLRSSHQKYVFASIESPDNYPICTTKYDNFFNWTWTYKLDSEVQWGFIVIRDFYNNVVGPKENMEWLKPEEMTPVSDVFKNKLKTKTIAVAWFVSNCFSRSRREFFAKHLQIELGRYADNGDADTYRIDIYGDCGSLQCPRDKDNNICKDMIREKYYFYLSFENSLSPDYVTEKLLTPLNNNAVPIVFGEADYSRFLPDRSYLNARKLGAVKLAETIYKLINNPEEYAEYFRWRSHYSYHHTTDAVDTNEYCKICELLNDDISMKNETVYSNFQLWWNNPGYCQKSKLLSL